MRTTEIVGMNPYFN